MTEFIKDTKQTRVKYPPMTRIQRSIVYVFANYHTSFRELGWSGILHYLIYSLFFFSHHQVVNCFSLDDQFIFIDNCFEINKMNHVLNCGQRYESECDPRS